MAEIEISKQDIHKAVLHFRSLGKMTPGINALQTYIGGGSQQRVKRLRDEVIQELDNEMGISGEMPEGLKSLWGQIQAQSSKEVEALQLKADEEVASLREDLKAMQDERDHHENLYKQASTELASAHVEIESLNDQLVERDLRIREVETQLVERDKQEKRSQVMFDEHKALTAEYNKASALRESGYHEQIQSLESKLLLLTQSYDQLVKNQMLQEQAHQAEAEKTWQTLAEELNNVGEIIEQSIIQTVSRDETQNTLVKDLQGLMSKIEKTQIDGQRHIMEQVLMIPELVKRSKEQVTKEELNNKLNDINIKLDTIVKRKDPKKRS